MPEPAAGWTAPLRLWRSDPGAFECAPVQNVRLSHTQGSDGDDVRRVQLIVSDDATGPLDGDKLCDVGLAIRKAL